MSQHDFFLIRTGHFPTLRRTSLLPESMAGRLTKQMGFLGVAVQHEPSNLLKAGAFSPNPLSLQGCFMNGVLLGTYAFLPTETSLHR